MTRCYLSLDLLLFTRGLPPTPLLFPYTTLFRSAALRGAQRRPARTPSRGACPPAETSAPRGGGPGPTRCSGRSEEHTSELQSRGQLVFRFQLENTKQGDYGF